LTVFQANHFNDLGMSFMRILLCVTPLLLAACGSQASVPVDVLAQKSAERLNSKGEDALAGIYPGSKVRAWVEGENTLVVRIENMPTGTRSVGAFEYNDAVRKRFCKAKNFSKLVSLGVRLRIETRSTIGRELPTSYIASCDS